MSKYIKILIILAIIVIVLASEGECRQKRPSRKRMRPPGSKMTRPHKRPRFSLFKARNQKPRFPPGAKNLEQQESKNVYYYSVPKRPTHRPRIILGEELNFNDMGIQEQQTDINPSPTPTFQSELTHELPNNIFSNSDIRHVKSLQNPNGRGPGYRMKGSLSDHYVLAQDYVHKKPRTPAVIPSVKRAAAELRNAYKSALIQSAKVAKFTTHVASNYFKGVRNIFLSDPDDERKPGYRGRADVELKEGASSPSPSPVIEELPSPQPLILEEADKEAIENLLPNVYLDWGGSFWKLFYKGSQVPST